MSLKKVSLILLTTCFCFASALFGASDHESRLDSLESQMKEVKETNISGSMGSKHPSTRCCPGNQGIFFNFEFLYWRAIQHGMVYAIDMQNLDITINYPTFGGDWIRIKYDWDPGLRVGIGWNSNHDNWDIQALWTYYRNHSSETTIAQNSAIGQGLATVWISNNQAPILAMSYAKATWKLDYNMFDLECGRSYFVSKNLSLRPHFGLRGGWLDQDFLILYENSLFAFPNNPTTPANFTGNSDYSGIGPRMGINTNWYLHKNFKMFANISGSLLYGKVKAHSRQNATNQDTNQMYIFEDINDRFYELLANATLFTGLSWGCCFSQDKYYFGLDLGWEATYWWDQLHISTLGDLFYNSPITLNGLTARAKIAF